MKQPDTIYYATDRDIHDLLRASKKKTSEDALFDLIKDRGIFLSCNEIREELIDEISSWNNDYFDLNVIIDHCDKAQRPEKTTSTKIESPVDSTNIKRILQQVSKENFDGIDITSENEGKIKATLTYTDTDYSRNSLSQKKVKEANIEIIREGGQLKIRTPSIDESKRFMTAFKEELKKIDSNLTESKIELSKLVTAHEKTNFFIKLVNELDGLTLEDVTSVRVEASNAFSFEDDDEEDIESNRMLGLVRQVIYNGKSLLEAAQYQESVGTGKYFISKIVWECIEISGEKNLVEIEAGYSEKDEGREFKYHIRNIRKPKIRSLDGSLDHAKTKISPSQLTRNRYLSKVEETAYKLFNSMVTKNEL